MLSTAAKRTIPLRAARGAALLDQFVPGWPAKVRREALKMADPNYCILGQTFGEFGDAVIELAGVAIAKTLKGAGIRMHPEHDLTNVEIDGGYYGFSSLDSVAPENENQEYDLLGSAWLGEIDARAQRTARQRAARKGVATRRANARRRR